MFRAPRVPRPSRPILLTILVTALLAFPMGIVLANHQFSDVPNSNPFHTDIDALVDSGVSAGCGSGKYCPKSVVTREQMAAFLNRLGALAPGKIPVVNADKVDGDDASDLKPRWALVAEDGTIVDQSGGITMADSFSGGYYLDFGSSVAGHAIVVTIKYQSASPTSVDGSAVAAPCGIHGTICSPAGTDNANHVWVLTRDGTGIQDGRPFYVAVLP